jgi:hypothetical protein
MRTWILFSLFFFALSTRAQAQCCAGGSGSPIAGGASQGVLMKNQAELNSNYQFISTDQFQRGDSPDTSFFDRYSSHYLYFRVGYGVTDRFTMSVEAGYYLSKNQDELGTADVITSSGIGDVILFPRYNVYRKKTEKGSTELTLGLGFKIPVGKYNDSIGHVEPFSGMTYYVTKPLSVQPSSGANDLIFYSFYYRGYDCDNLRFFTNAMYIRKGWNPNGEKMGDYASVGLFAGRSFRCRLNATAMFRAEWVDRTQVNDDILMYTALSYDPAATGSKKIFAGLQLGFAPFDGMMLYASSEYPLYQYVTRSQVVSQWQITAGVSYRFQIRTAAADDRTSDVH